MGLHLWDHAAERRHRRSNRLHSALLLAGMAALLAACGWVIGGPSTLLWALLGGLLGLGLSPGMSPGLVLRLYRARPVAPRQWPELYDVLERLAAAAGLETVPVLHIVPAPAANAFAVGGRGGAAIAVTEGLLARLDLRELAAVLAHEISHIRNGDLRLMGLADLISRLTRLMAWMGLVLLVLSLPLVASGEAGAPLPLVALLMAAPSFSALMQLALARTREFDADLDAATLTGDPEGLIRALRKMEAPEPTFWGRIWLPRRQPRDDPSLLRTHPSTEERIERLRALHVPLRLEFGPHALVPPTLSPVARRPWRWPHG